jgi:hypothetical protein
LEAGSPDGINSNQKIPIWVSFGDLEIDIVGIFYGQLEHLMAIWYILLPFSNFMAILYVYFPPFWNIVSRKIWQPISEDFYS